MSSSSGYWGARPDIASAIARLRVWDKSVPAKDIPCLCMRLTAAGMLTLAINRLLDIQCAPVRWRLYGELVPVLFGHDETMLFKIEPGFYRLG